MALGLGLAETGTAAGAACTLSVQDASASKVNSKYAVLVSNVCTDCPFKQTDGNRNIVTLRRHLC